GQRLRVDVALIGQGQAEGLQEGGDVAQPGARVKAHPPAGFVDGDDAAELVEADHDVSPGGDRGEGVTGADDAQSLTGDRCPIDDVGQRLDRGGSCQGVRMGVDVARPVPERLPGSAPVALVPIARACVASGPAPTPWGGSVSAHHAHSTSPSPRYVDQVSTTDDPFTTRN